MKLTSRHNRLAQPPERNHTLDTILSFGWLLPAWIVSTPLLAAAVVLMTTPKGSHRSIYPDARNRTGLTGTVGGRDGQVLSR